MPDTRNALYVLFVGAGFFVVMYQWVTMIAETLPLTRRAEGPGRNSRVQAEVYRWSIATLGSPTNRGGRASVRHPRSL